MPASDTGAATASASGALQEAALHTAAVLKDTPTMARRQSGLSGRIPAGLANVTTLRALDLSFNSLSGSIPSALTSCLTRLLHLGLQSNRLSGAIPPLDRLTQVSPSRAFWTLP
ncbi:hypothetical protein CLOM_g20539 [Closterium sp. NIES-68]|nr:hypothetical protein CLOM_g20539 [Closterium sp. NIES-68]